MLLPTLVLTLTIIGLAIIGMGLRVIFVKNGEFRGSCASNNPALKNETGDCPVCGKTPEEDCKREDVELSKIS